MNTMNPTTPHPQRQRIDAALHHLYAVIEHWDEKQVLEYPATLPSFDEYVAEVAGHLRSIRWAGEES